MNCDAHNGPLLSAGDWGRLRKWYRQYGRHGLPWRSLKDLWALLVAETLLHRTKAETVARIFTDVIEEFSSPEPVLSRPDRWIEVTSSLGLIWRTRTFVDMCRVLAYRYNGRVPQERKELLALPGVGNYVADSVLCFGLGQPTILVDTNTIRLTVRISGTPLYPAHHRTSRVRRAVHRLGKDGALLSGEDNLALLDLAALICTPRDPGCLKCPLQETCVTGRKLFLMK